MKTNSTRSLKWLTGVTMIFGAIYLLTVGAQTCGVFIGKQPVVWQDEIRILQSAIAIFRFLGAAATVGCVIAFLMNSIKALKNGVLFPRKNVGILFATAAASFILIWCGSNIHIVFGSRSVNLGLEEILVPVVICAFAIIYRVAVHVSEENNLTI